MRLNFKSLQIVSLLIIILVFSAAANFAAPNDDDIPEITARVARVSFIKGEAQIRRAGYDEWEKVTKNLPVVEGDEIATSAYTLLEIQFDTYKYLRLTDNTFLTITTLRDGGIALSVPQGSVSMRVFEFDKDREFVEIDAPQTTVAVQQKGTYRVDAGDENYRLVHVKVTDGGEARVYSKDAGFALHDGRTARIFTEGEYADEWDLDAASRNMDQFDTWASERDEVIAELLRKADYDKYYDRDIYGAEDLNFNGEWIYTSDYGYVWRPYQNAINQYDDWSPYRYGQWRWVPPYGWTWINDEAWGWATYHHGRWVYYNGSWYWTPRSSRQSSRNWWRPALVVVASIGRNICWYPLPYSYSYYNYNYYFYNSGDRHRRDRSPRDNSGGNGNPTPTPTPAAVTRGRVFLANDGSNKFRGLPPNSVVAVDQSDFGRGKTKFRTAPLDVAKQTLLKKGDQINDTPILPVYKDLNGDVSRDIIVQNPRNPKFDRQVKIGASVRKTGDSVDEQLRQKQVYGNRQPILQPNNNGDDNNSGRRTGAVKRIDKTNIQAEPVSPGIIQPNSVPPRRIRKNSEERRIEEPSPPQKSERKQSPPVVEYPSKDTRIQPNERRQPPPREQPPNNPPPPVEPKQRVEPPAPKVEPPREVPPPKSEPKTDPDVSIPNGGKTKPGRDNRL